MITIAAPIRSLGRYFVSDDSHPSTRDLTETGVEAQPRSFSPRGGGHGTETTLSFFLPEASQVRVRVFNLSGRLVKTVFEGGLSSGLQAISWNGYDRDNELCPTGLYVLTIESQVLNERKTVMVLNDK
jgi:hypothetical protein